MTGVLLTALQRDDAKWVGKEGTEAGLKGDKAGALCMGLWHRGTHFWTPTAPGEWVS